MNNIVCPRCGTENPADAMNCKNCRINLQYAIDHPDQIERTNPEDTQREKTTPQLTASQRSSRVIALSVLLLMVCCVAWFFSSLYLSPPVIGPCAHGGANYDTYTALVRYWTLHLIIGFLIVVGRIGVWAEVQNDRTRKVGLSLNIIIGVWTAAAFLIWFLIFAWLCV